MLALAVLGGGLYAPVGVGGPRRTTYKPPGLSLDPYKRKSHKYRDVLQRNAMLSTIDNYSY